MKFYNWIKSDFKFNFKNQYNSIQTKRAYIKLNRYIFMKI